MAAKKTTSAAMFRLPGVNNAGAWGRWAFIEITDPWDAKNALSSYLQSRGTDHA